MRYRDFDNIFLFADLLVFRSTYASPLYSKRSNSVWHCGDRTPGRLFSKQVRCQLSQSLLGIWKPGWSFNRILYISSLPRPVLDRFNQPLSFLHCPLFNAVLLSIHISSIKYFGWKNFGTPRIEPRTAGWEAQTLPLCYSVPPSIYSSSSSTISSTPSTTWSWSCTRVICPAAPPTSLRRSAADRSEPPTTRPSSPRRTSSSSCPPWKSHFGRMRLAVLLFIHMPCTCTTFTRWFF